ncbi:MAG: acyl-CoA oxidase, partial [Lewinella sp.]|nr:acyl-CoA oxidase [Lewinella sp.]
GDNTVLLQLVAKGVLSDFRQAFYEDGQLATLRFIGRRINTVLTEQNPFVIRNTDEVHLRSPEFHASAFSFREKRLLASLAQRLRGHIKDGKSAYEASLICQTHMLSLAEAYVERLVLSVAHERLAAAPPELRPILQKLIALYALSTIEQHKGWYLEQDYLAGSKSKAIRRSIDGLCADLRPEAVGLVDAWGIPEQLLGAPIARKEEGSEV